MKSRTDRGAESIGDRPGQGKRGREGERPSVSLLREQGGQRGRAQGNSLRGLNDFHPRKCSDDRAGDSFRLGESSFNDFDKLGLLMDHVSVWILDRVQFLLDCAQ